MRTQRSNPGFQALIGTILGLGLSLSATRGFCGDGAGEGTRGGGDTVTMNSYQIAWRSQDLENFARSFLKDDLIQYVQKIDFKSNWVYPRFQEAMGKMTRQALIDDINKSSYSFNSICRDEKGERKGLSTVIGQRGGEICFDIQYLFKHGTTRSQLVGLAFHDHARHFYVDDEDHGIANYVAGTYDQTVAWKTRRTECTATRPGVLAQTFGNEAGAVTNRVSDSAAAIAIAEGYLGVWELPTGVPHSTQTINSTYSFVLKLANPDRMELIALQVFKNSMWGGKTLLAEARAPLGESVHNYPFDITVYSGTEDIEVHCVSDYVSAMDPKTLKEINGISRSR